MHDEPGNDEKDDNTAEGATKREALKQKGHELRYVIIDERLKQGRLVKRYILKVTVKPKDLMRATDKFDIVLCNWPSCMQKTRQSIV